MFSGTSLGSGMNRASFEVGSRNAECGMEKNGEVGMRNAEGGNENDLKAEVGMRKAE